MLPEEIPDWARNCSSGKQRYSSAEEARREYRIKLRGKVKDPKGTFHAYQCAECGFYHTTSTARKNNKRKHKRWYGPKE